MQSSFPPGRVPAILNPDSLRRDAPILQPALAAYFHRTTLLQLPRSSLYSQQEPAASENEPAF